MAFTWYGRRMKTANVGGTAISYKYNADGLRTEKKVGSTVHTYEYTGNTLFYENRGGTELHYRYDVNGNLASITRVKADGTKFTLYAICNSRGDVEELRQLNGSLYARYVYDTWGNTLHIYDANGAEITNTNNLALQNPIRYRGYYFDAETGLYYLQSRYYDPVTCRFINADVLIDTSHLSGFSLFTYCLNNPVVYSDYTGAAVETIWDIISWGLSAIDVILNPSDPLAWLGLGLDTAAILIPFVPALGVSSKFDDIFDIFRFVENSDDVTDTIKVIDKANDANKQFSTLTVPSSVRQSAVAGAWRNEFLNVKSGGHGISRVWTDQEVIELLETGKVKGYQGHHMKSVKGYPELAEDPYNIQFLSRTEHLQAHNGNWKNITHGRFIILGG